MLICPGGGYRNLALDKEGYKLAEWFNEKGMTAFVLKYRLNNQSLTAYKFPAQLNDAQRAMRWIRANAAKYHLDSTKIGVMGFSAGGHLASMLSTHFDSSYYILKDKLDSISARPDFSILIYPVITLNSEYTHAGSRTNLLGAKEYSVQIADFLSSDKQVTSNTPPTFLVHASDDKVVPPQNSILYYLALKYFNIAAELHIYEKGGHGFGMAPQNPVLSAWLGQLTGWLINRGILSDNSTK